MNTFIISVIAGITIEHIEYALEFKGAIARAMPNTSAALGKSATAISFNPLLSSYQKSWTITFVSIRRDDSGGR